MISLRPYQEATVQAVYDHLRNRDDNPCAVVPTAGGKTPIMATICRDAVTQWNGRVLILAHVKELLEQTADKLRIVCPEVEFGIYSAGLKRRDTEAPVIIAGIQSVYRRACELDAFDLVLVDECFVEGTMVSTPSGEIPIEFVQPGMFVCHARGVDRVVATSAKSANELVTLEFSDGTEITCTPNHPIFTETGWRCAGTMEVGSLAIGVEGMRMLWEKVSSLVENSGRWESSGAEREALDEAAILLDLLLEDPQQLHASPRSTKKDQSDDEISRTLAEDTGRERPAFPTTVEIAETTGGRLGWGARRSRPWFSSSCAAEEPQDRRGSPGADDCDRAGRPKSPVATATTPRLTEVNLPGAKRLVSRSHHKSAGGRVVFNLHVAGHPSYFANGTLVHNCHLIPIEGDGMYRQFLADAKIVNPHIRIVGFTATPFRLKTGPICTADGFLNHICFEVGVRELIRDGFLCPLISKAGKAKADTSSLHIRGGEFVADEVESLMDDSELVEAACTEIVEQTETRNACLIFASGVQHGRHIVRILQEKHGIECGFVCGDTPTPERDEVLKRFKAGGLKYLCNVNVLTTGFDAPHIDCVALVRPTMSPGLYYQMVGRGFRLHDSKQNCLILDFGGNVLRHGPVDAIKITTLDRGDGKAPAKECPACQALIAAGFSTCPACGYEFPPPERKQHDAKASEAGVLSGQMTETKFTVLDTIYSVHIKRGADDDAPRSLRVDYKVGWHEYKSEWICFEHQGYARQKAEAWWRCRSRDPIPNSARRAVEIIEGGGLAQAQSIIVRSVSGDPYERIVEYELGPIPELVDTESLYDLDEVPF
ncbi:MAG TPA: helicase-related protein [Pirellulaceae bacterium]|nr:helicase-related protein [Pirellulaceae bacterium]